MVILESPVYEDGTVSNSVRADMSIKEPCTDLQPLPISSCTVTLDASDAGSHPKRPCTENPFTSFRSETCVYLHGSQPRQHHAPASRVSLFLPCPPLIISVTKRQQDAEEQPFTEPGLGRSTFLGFWFRNRHRRVASEGLQSPSIPQPTLGLQSKYKRGSPNTPWRPRAGVLSCVGAA